MFGTDENLPEYVVTAHNVDPYFRVKMQGVVQNTSIALFHLL